MIFEVLAILILLGISPFLWFLAILALRAKPPAKGGAASEHFFAVVVPAHNEGESLGPTLESLKALDYPKEQVVIYVISDNCTDQGATEACARRAGVEVWVRTDPQKKSKGYALAWAIPKILDKPYDALVIVDADTLVDSHLLKAFSKKLQQGREVLQCYYTARNPDASWRTQLVTYAFSLINGVYQSGLDRIGLGAHLRGNGMAFSRSLLMRMPWQAASLAEDLEFSWALRLQGVAGHFVSEARVYGELVASQHKGAQSQRKRWEEGRRQLKAQFLKPLLQANVSLLTKMGLVIDLLMPPLVPLVGCLGVSGILLGGSRGWPLFYGGVLGILVLIYGFSPLYRHYAKVSQLKALFYLPLYALWKFKLLWTKKSDQWLRTQREQEL